MKNAELLEKLEAEGTPHAKRVAETVKHLPEADWIVMDWEVSMCPLNLYMTVIKPARGRKVGRILFDPNKFRATERLNAIEKNQGMDAIHRTSLIKLSETPTEMKVRLGIGFLSLQEED